MNERKHHGWRRSPGWLIGFPVAVGASTGAVGTACWQSASARYYRCTAATDSLDCAALPIIQFLVGVPIAIAVIWILLAIAEFRIWIPPIVMLGGLAAGTYAVNLFEAALPDGRPPAIWVGAVIGGAAFGAVAFACLPALHWTVRLLVVVALLAVAVIGTATPAGGTTLAPTEATLGTTGTPQPGNPTPTTVKHQHTSTRPRSRNAEVQNDSPQKSAAVSVTPSLA